MPSPLEKARRDPDSMKAKILTCARKLYGEYGYHGTTTRMIAKAVGIDISTLYYHWGEKRDLYEAVVMDLNHDIYEKLIEIEKKVRGKSLETRLEVAIDTVSDYLFSNPEVSKLILVIYFSKTRPDESLDITIPHYIDNIAVAMGLASDKNNISLEAKAKVLALWNSVFTFIAGENLFKPVLNVDSQKYLEVVKQTLKFILIPAFAMSKE